jgi:molybdenum cofactor cytidylyltransferase
MVTAAVVLAAGRSERMRKNKLLLMLDGKRLIDHNLDALKASNIDKIVVVLGHKPWEVTDVLNSRLNHIRIVINNEYEVGMSSSFKTGLNQTGNAEAVLLVLGDQPILDYNLINRMIELMEEKKSRALIVSPVHKGKKGHPLLFSKGLFREIMGLKKNEMIRDIVHRHSDALLTIESDEWTLIDIDTPLDLEKAKRLLKKTKLTRGMNRKSS